MNNYKGKLYRKLLLIYLPVLVLSFIALNILRQAKIEAKRNFSVRAEIIRHNINSSINLWLENNARIAHLLSLESRVTELCKQPQNSEIKQNADALFANIFQSNKALKNICLFADIPQNSSINLGSGNILKFGDALLHINQIHPENKENIKKLLVKSLQSKKQSISPVYFSAQGEPIVYLISPVIEKNKVLGAIFMQLNLNYFTDKIIGNFEKIEDQTSIFLFNPERLITIDTIKIAIKDDFKPSELLSQPEKNLFYQTTGSNEYLINYQSIKINEFNQQENWYIAVFQESNFINAFIKGKLSKLVPIIVLMLILYGALIVITTKNLVINPLNKTVDEIQKFAEGDLQTEITDFKQDEIGYIAQQLYEAKLNLSSNIIGLLQEKSAGIDLQNKVVMEIAENLVQNANEEAAAVEEISATTEEFLSMAKQNAKITDKNTREAQNLGASLEILTKSVKQTADALMDISEQIGIIDEIASKTDLLAINAAIEASRSGESGKGFAVVADEIKKLAAKTTKASAQIKSISNDSKEKASRTTNIIEMAIPKIRELVNDLRRINEAVKEQENGVVQINSSILQLSSTSQNNLGRTEELSGTVQELSNIVVDLNKIVTRFKTNKTKSEKEQIDAQHVLSETKKEEGLSNASLDEEILALEEESLKETKKNYIPKTDFPSKININLKDDDFESY